MHVIADVETEIPIALEIALANRNDKIFFHELYNTVKERFAVHMKPNAKFLADAAYNSTDKHVQHWNVVLTAIEAKK